MLNTGIEPVNLDERKQILNLSRIPIPPIKLTKLIKH